MMTNTISTLKWTITMKRDLTEQKEVRQHTSKMLSFLSLRGKGVVEFFQILVFPLCSISSHKFSIVFYSVLMLIPKFPIGYRIAPWKFSCTLCAKLSSCSLHRKSTREAYIYLYIFWECLNFDHILLWWANQRGPSLEKANWSVGVLIAK
jgi:hypothetical protein